MRLIDADELKKKIRRCDDSATRVTFDYVYDDDIDDAPTIDVLEQIRAELVEDYENYSASEVNFDFACGIKRAIDTIDYHINHKAESEE